MIITPSNLWLAHRAACGGKSTITGAAAPVLAIPGAYGVADRAHNKAIRPVAPGCSPPRPDRTAAVAVLAGVLSSAVNRCRRLHWGMTKVEIGGCVVCDRADLDEVDARILSKPVGYPTERGRTWARMAKELNVDPDALASHAKRHTRSATHQQRRALEAAARLAAVRQYVGAP